MEIAGCLHDDEGRIRRRWATKRWIACRLEFRGWKRERLLQPGRFTELFFLDEATAFAAGHRPCALCRREDYVRFGGALPRAERGGRDGRAAPRASGSTGATGASTRWRLEELPDGAFVLEDGEPWLVCGDELLRWSPAGYAEQRPREPGTARLITPPSLGRDSPRRLGGAVPLLHPTAAQTATALSSPTNAR